MPIKLKYLPSQLPRHYWWVKGIILMLIRWRRQYRTDCSNKHILLWKTQWWLKILAILWFFFDVAFFSSQTVYGAGPLPAPHWDPWERLPPSEPPKWDSDCKCFLEVFQGGQKTLHWPRGRKGLIPLCLLHCEY